MPKCPRSSGPLRKELGNAELIVAFRHGRARPGHPRLACFEFQQTWMPGTSPGMTTLNGLPRSSTARAGRNRILLSHARGANKGADQLGILDAGRPLHAGVNINAAGARDANGLRDIRRIEAARNHERQLEVELLKHMPVEHRAK